MEHTKKEATFTARFDPEALAGAQDVAAELDISLGHLVRQAVDEFVERHGRRQQGVATPDATVIADGVGWASYAVSVHYSVPALLGADQRSYDLKDALIREAIHWGGRDVWTEEWAVRAMEPDLRQVSTDRPAEPVTYSTDEANPIGRAPWHTLKAVSYSGEPSHPNLTDYAPVPGEGSKG